jgi:hypothetical protein
MIEFKESFFARYVADEGLAPANPAAAYADHAEFCLTYLASLPEGKAAYRYAPDKWSVKQVVGHFTDTSFIHLYRLTVIARGETQALPGFDENLYAENAPYDSMSWRAVLEAYRGVTQAALGLVSALDPAAWERRGCANDTRITPEQLIRVLIGHERHHIRVLKERYGLG